MARSDDNVRCQSSTTLTEATEEVYSQEAAPPQLKCRIYIHRTQPSMNICPFVDAPGMRATDWATERFGKARVDGDGLTGRGESNT